MCHHCLITVLLEKHTFVTITSIFNRSVNLIYNADDPTEK